jgi:hypothetical protein
MFRSTDMTVYDASKILPITTPTKTAAYLIEKIGSTVSGYFHPSLWLSESHDLLVTQGHDGIDTQRPPHRNDSSGQANAS